MHNIPNYNISKGIHIFPTDNFLLNQSSFEHLLHQFKQLILFKPSNPTQSLKTAILSNKRSHSQHVLAFVV